MTSDIDGGPTDDCRRTGSCASDGSCDTTRGETGCPSGSTCSAAKCIDIDECATNNGGCGRTSCSNVKGGRVCGECPLDAFGGGDLPCIPRLIGLGDLPGGDVASFAASLNDSGDVVVGWSRTAEGDAAIRWTPTGGLAALGGAGSQAHAASPDGRFIVGMSAVSSYNGGPAAVVWRDEQALALLTPAMIDVGEPYVWPIDAWVVRNDGSAFGTCLQDRAYGDHLACAIDRAGNLTQHSIGEIYAADDRSNYAGMRTPGTRGGPTYASKATLNDSILGFPDAPTCVPPCACASAVRAFSDGAAVVVGTSSVPAVGDTTTGEAQTLIDSAFVYTGAEGMHRLPELTDNAARSGAYAIDASGHIIAGFGTDREYKQVAVIWIDRKPVNLAALLAKLMITPTFGWRLQEIRAISRDGLTVTGNATNPMNVPEAFWVRLPVGAFDSVR